MTVLSIILVSPDNIESGKLTDTCNSLLSQSFADYEIIISKDMQDKYQSLIQDILVNKSIIVSPYSQNKLVSYLNNALEESSGKYLYFMRIGDVFSLNDILSSYVGQLDENNLELIQSRNNIKEDNTPKKYDLSIIDFYSRNVLYKTIFKREYLRKQGIVFRDNSFYEQIFFMDVLLSLNNYHIELSNFTDSRVSNSLDLDELTEYLKLLNDMVKRLLESQCHDYLYQLSINLLEVDYKGLNSVTMEFYEHISQLSADILESIRDVDGLIIYYFKKYLRTIDNLLYNQVHDFSIKVSVIIPTYNVEDYIDDCLNSIIHQTLRDIEVICVDDASTDSTRDILKYYEQKDERVRCFYMEENMGSGGCRNFALKHARGKYVQYVDADDWIDLEGLKIFFDNAESHKAQILMYNAILYRQWTNEFYKYKYYEMKHLRNYLNKVFSIDDVYKRDLMNMAVVPWNKLYLRSFLEDIDAKFPEKLIHQDNPFFFHTFLNVDRIYFITNYSYNHRERTNSITGLRNEIEIGIVRIIELILLTFMDNSVYEVYKKELLNRLFAKFKMRYKVVREPYRPMYYTALKKMLDKFLNYYGLKDDIYTYLTDEHKSFLEKVLNTQNHDQFKEIYQNKK